MKRGCAALNNKLHGYTQRENVDCIHCIQDETVGSLLSAVHDGRPAGPSETVMLLC